ncbi:hypothetical protein IJ182_09340 [bacterium]|nr:hypothetical protein [bacterium]
MSSDITTKRLAAFFADQAYHIPSNNTVSYNNQTWVRIAESHNIDGFGFDGDVYYNEDSKQMIVALRGTEFTLDEDGYLDFIKTDIQDFGFNKEPKQYTAAKNLLDSAISILQKGNYSDLSTNQNIAIDTTNANLMIVGHSLGGGLAQLLGSQIEYSQYHVETFNAIGVKQMVDNLSKKGFNFSGNYCNIENNVISRDFVSTIYNHLGPAIVYKPSEENQLNISDYLPLRFYKDDNSNVQMEIFSAVQKMLKGHTIANFTDETSFIPENSKFTYQTLCSILKTIKGGVVLEEVIAPILTPLILVGFGVAYSGNKLLDKIFRTNRGEATGYAAGIIENNTVLQGYISVLKDIPDEYDDVCQIFVDNDFKFVAETIDQNNNIVFYIYNNEINATELDNIVDNSIYFEAYNNGQEIIYNKIKAERTLYIFQDENYLVDDIKNLINNSNSIDIAILNEDYYGNSTIIGDINKNMIDGGIGNDTVYAGNGNDVILGNEGEDEIHGEAGNDVLIAGSVQIADGLTEIPYDTLKNLINSKDRIRTVINYESENGSASKLYGEEGDDLLIGDKGNDTLDGGIGNDYIYGGNGNDVLQGNDNNDYLNGNEGTDTINGGSGNDILVGGEGYDELYGGENNDVLIAGNHKNVPVITLQKLLERRGSVNPSEFQSTQGISSVLYGNAGNDLLIGDKGSDTLYGGADDDYLYGGKGNDYLSGGDGYDVYKLFSGDGYNTIYDSDKAGRIEVDGYTLRGATKKRSEGGRIWRDVRGNTYFWAANSDVVIINGNTRVLNFENGKTLGITLRVIDDEEEEEEPTNPDEPGDDTPTEPTNPDDPENPVTPGDEPENPENDEEEPTPSNEEEIRPPKIGPKFRQAEDSPGTPSDPIILDLDGNGIQISEKSKYFDHGNDGFAESSSWVSGNDGILAVDNNNNNRIDNGTELLTHDSLTEFDTNEDGIIDANDTDFERIKVLKANGSLQSLQDAGVEFISLNTKAAHIGYYEGSYQFAKGKFTTTDGQECEYGELNLQTDPENALDLNIVYPTSYKTLPEIDNMGKSYSLRHAMYLDSTETLKTLVESFVSETDDDVRMNLVDQILEQWAGATEVVEGSRGQYADAKQLAILEVFMGTEFYSQHEGEAEPSNPNLEASQYLATAYARLKTYIYAELMSQTHLDSIMQNLKLLPNEQGKLAFDLSDIVSILQDEMEVDAVAARQKVYEVAKVIKGLGYDVKSNFFDPKDDNCFYTTFTENDRELKWLIDTISKVPYTDNIGDGECTSADDAMRANRGESAFFHALRGDDVIYGDSQSDGFAACSGDDLLDGGDGDDNLDAHGGNDTVFGGKGNDTINPSDGDDVIFGGSGNDVIYPDGNESEGYNNYGRDIIRGGTGNDTIHSFSGDDTFIFNLGDGKDVVFEKQGVDTLYFGEDISWEDLEFEQVGNDMVISITDTEDQITVKNWFVQDNDGVYRYDNRKIEIFEFADGSKHYKDEILVGDNTEAVTYDMDDIGDDLNLSNGYKNIVNLKEGWNHIFVGKDTTNTFVFDRQGIDLCIENSTYKDSIIFGEGITLAKTFFAFNENDLEVWFEDYDGHISITYGDDYLETFVFNDGTVLLDVYDHLQRVSTYYDYIMNDDKMDDVTLLGYYSNMVIGNNKDNNIYGNYGNTTFEGGRGNDNLYSYNGGNDEYVYNLGDGDDRITDLGGIDTIRFGEGITTENVTFLRNFEDDSLEIFINTDEGGNIKIENFFGEGNNNKIEYFEFADGTTFETIDNHINALGSTDNNDLVLPEGIREGHLRGEGHISNTGNDMDNWLGGNSGDNRFYAGEGDDAMWDDNSSNDRYYYNVGDGNDNIGDTSGIDAIIFGAGITKQNIRFEKQPDNLFIYFDGIEGSICINEYFNDDNRKIELFKFADGSIIDDITPYISDIATRDEDIILTGNQENASVWDGGEVSITGNNLHNRLYGSWGNNTIQGAGGNDYIQDENGDDVYIYNVGDGDDEIFDMGGYDKIQFGQGITPQNIIFTQNLNDLIITFDNIDGSIKIDNYFNPDTIEEFEFYDETVITDITPYLNCQVTDSDYTMTNVDVIDDVRVISEEAVSVEGNSRDNIIMFIDTNGEDGNQAQGNGGNDTIIDNAGTNTTYVYNVGDGNDRIIDNGGTDKITFGTGITTNNIRFIRDENYLVIQFDGISGSIIIDNYFGDENNTVETFEFSDNSQITDISELYTEAVAPIVPRVQGYDSTNIRNIVDNYQGSVVLDENDINTTITGTGNAYVLGNEDDNIIVGNSGNNTYAGGGGDDIITDTLGGNDTYLYNYNNGNDVITDSNGIDTVKFGRDIHTYDLRFEQIEKNLVISFRDEGREGSLTINNYFLNDTSKIENFVFDDGTVITDISGWLAGITTYENYTMQSTEWFETVRIGGNDSLSVTGNSWDNKFIGNGGDNTFQGNGGDDTLIDHAGGNDTYIYNLGDGNDVIDDIGGLDTIRFGEGITTDNLAFMKTSTDLNIWFHNLEGGLTIKDYYTNPAKQIERFELYDGTVITDVESHITAIGSEQSIVLPNGVSQAHLWGDGDTSVVGNSEDNWIGGNSGDNTITGGLGDDYINSEQGGNDTFIYNLGDGHDHILEYEGYDIIQFGQGIAQNNLRFIRNEGDLLINFVDNNGDDIDGSIRVEGYFYDWNRQIEEIQFADGSSIRNIESKVTILAGENDINNDGNYQEIRAWGDGNIKITGSYASELIQGNSGNNTYDPQGGNDTISDINGGDDTYIYKHDSENKYITDIGGFDKIKLGDGLDIYNTRFIRKNDDLALYFPNQSNVCIQISDYFTDNDHKIERFEFADETVITDVTNYITGTVETSDVQMQNNYTYVYLEGNSDVTVTGNNLNNEIYGNSGDNTYIAGIGDDRIEDRKGGDDTYIYNLGDGNDSILDISGNDTIRFGNGITQENIRFINNRGSLQIFIDVENYGGGIWIDDYFRVESRKIETIEFANGTTISDVTPYLSGITVTDNYTISEESPVTEVYLNGTGDYSLTGNSADNHFDGNAGNNTYQGGEGNDSYWDDQGGNDTYIYNLGDGDDNIGDYRGYDTLRLGAGITANMLRIQRCDNGDMEIRFDGEEGSIRIQNVFNGDSDWNFERIILADETVITDFSPYYIFAQPTQDYSLPQNNSIQDVFVQGDGNVSITGNNYNNYIEGGSGNNTYQANGGDDYINDTKGGNDTYIINIGDGNDTIRDISGYDKIVFGEGLNVQDMKAMNGNNDSLHIWFDGVDNTSLVIENFYSNPNAAIERFEFFDGTVITDISNYINCIASESNIVLPEGYKEAHMWGGNNISATGNSEDNQFYGNWGNNTIQGGTGNDNIMDDQGGNDTYIYNLGDGDDNIGDCHGIDTIRLGQGITANMLQMRRWNEDDMLLDFAGEEGSILIQHYYSDDTNWKIERIVLADDTVITDFTPYMETVYTSTDYELSDETYKKDIVAEGTGNISLTGNWNNNIIEGNSGNNTFQGNGGDDRLSDTIGGNDTYILNMGDGNDTILDIGGIDTIRFGEGLNLENIRVMNGNNDSLHIWFDGVDNTGLVVENFFSNQNAAIERFEFFDGTVVTDISNYINCIASENNIVLPNGYVDAHLWGEENITATGNSGNNGFQGNSGNNTYNGGQGDDGYWDHQGGNDTYIYNLGDGWDWLSDMNGIDTIRFGEGITADMIRMSRDGNTLNINFTNQDGGIGIEGQFEENSGWGIERIELYDNTVITDFTPFYQFVETNTNYTLSEQSNKPDVVAIGDGDISLTGNSQNNYLQGNSGDNAFQGNAGDDWSKDFEGNDTYIYNLGDGNDWIDDYSGYDVIRFGQGITESMLRMEGDEWGNLRIYFDGEEGSIMVGNYFNDENASIEKIILSDNTELTDFSPYMPSVDIYENYTLPENSPHRDVYIRGEGNISVTGNSNDNYIEGNDGNNTYQGNGGNDYIADREGGNDVYIYNIGDGWDTIEDIGGIDTIRFGEGINVQDMKVKNRLNNSIDISFDGIDGELVIENCLNNNDCVIERFEFFDGTVITNINNYINCIASENNITLPEGYREAHMWGENNISVVGNSGDNWIGGNSGNNTVQGGAGNDNYWDDQGGDDTFIYNLGDGDDWIENYGGYDTIQFGSGITASMLRMENEDGHLRIFFDGEEGSLVVGNYFNDDNAKFERIVLSDNTIITDITPYMPYIETSVSYTLPEETFKRDIIGQGNGDITLTGNSNNNYIEGTSGNNTYQGNGGNDYISDTQGGNDVYIYNLGDGDDTIEDIGGIDTIRFGEGLNVEDMQVMNGNNNSLHIWFNGVDGSLCINNFFSNVDAVIERFEFYDNTVITNINNYINCIASEGNIILPQGYNQAHLWGENNTSATGNSNDNWIGGNSGDNTIQGGAGNDCFWDDQGGDDTFIYNLGDGDDWIDNYGGYDTIQFGSGITSNMLQMESDEWGNLIITFAGEEGSIGIGNYFNDENAIIERIVLSDNTVITDFTPFMPYVETSVSYTLSEGSFKRDIIGQGNGDIALTGNSSDNYIEGTSGNNTYQGNEGNDYISDTQGGNDTYIINLGDGADTIHDINGYDKIVFGEGLNVQDMQVMNGNNDSLIIWFNETDVNVTIENYFNTEEYKKIERFEFFDGTIITDIENYINCIASEGNIVLPEGYNQAHLWGDGNTSATGNSNDNWIGGNSGDNTFQGNGGNDYYWSDQGGNDIYIYNLGDGYDTIADYSGYDSISFGQGITSNMLSIRRHEGGEINITFANQDGAITVQNVYTGDNNWAIEKFIFSDNTEITDFSSYYTFVEPENNYTLSENSNIQDIYAVGENNIILTGNTSDNIIVGNFGNNTIIGGLGNDTLRDYSGGDDTYVYNIGDGDDSIHDFGGNDKIKLGTGINSSDIRLMIDDYNNIHMSIFGHDGGIFIQRDITDNAIENIELADNTLIDIDTHINQIGSEFNDIVLPTGYLDAQLWGNADLSVTGNSLNNIINGNDGNNTYQGNGGNDEFNDGLGDDTYIYNVGDGHDIIKDYNGDDTIEFGTGITTQNIHFLHQSDNYNNLVISFTGFDGSITVEDYFNSETNNTVETFTFSDNTSYTDISSYIETPPEDDEPIDEEEPDLPFGGLGNLDLNSLQQEMSTFGSDGDIVVNNFEQQQEDDLLLVMNY